jgi:peptidyl-prolyl cis-trans isomerase A (cyclophilin A)
MRLIFKIIIGIVVIAALLIIAGAMAGLYTPAKLNTNNNPTPTPTETSSATPTTNPTQTSQPSTVGTKVLLHTTVGDIIIQLRTDKPITTANFINIVQKGWYNGTTFHRVISGFMIQGGAINQTIPSISDEIGNNNRNLPYTIAMAKTNQPNSATSQFFINVADNGNNPYNPTFDSTYTVFGTVISGQSVVDTIANAQVTTNPVTGEISQPVNPVTIVGASITT